MLENKSLVRVERIERLIILIRNHKVIFNTDLADMYGVETKVLNQAVKRNIECFPSDFVSRLTNEKSNTLRSQFVIVFDAIRQLMIPPEKEHRPMGFHIE